MSSRYCMNHIHMTAMFVGGMHHHLKIKQRDEEVKIEMWQSYIDTSPKDIN